jgi:hypothetical protein
MITAAMAPAGALPGMMLAATALLIVSAFVARVSLQRKSSQAASDGT